MAVRSPRIIASLVAHPFGVPSLSCLAILAFARQGPRPVPATSPAPTPPVLYVAGADDEGEGIFAEAGPPPLRPRRLTRPPPGHRDGSPSPSADGKLVAYIRWPAVEGPSELHVVQADGTNDRVVALQVAPSRPAFTAAGRVEYVVRSGRAPGSLAGSSAVSAVLSVDALGGGTPVAVGPERAAVCHESEAVAGRDRVAPRPPDGAPSDRCAPGGDGSDGDSSVGVAAAAFGAPSPVAEGPFIRRRSGEAGGDAFALDAHRGALDGPPSSRH